MVGLRRPVGDDCDLAGGILHLELVAGGSCWDNWQQTTKLDGTTRWYLDFNGNGTWDMSEGRA